MSADIAWLRCPIFAMSPLSFELKVSVVDDHDTPKTAEAEIFGGLNF